jgi:hypothetical protein
LFYIFGYNIGKSDEKPFVISTLRALNVGLKAAVTRLNSNRFDLDIGS